MIRLSFSPGKRARYAAFTLIELLTVIAIILVLAGLLLHIAGSANYKASTARAQSEIQAMSTALESYKADNGSYPRPTTAGTDSDALNAQSDINGDATSSYVKPGQFLYQSLSGFPVTGTVYNKRYMEFKPGQISTGSATPTTSTYVIDPFGLCYGYSTAAAYQTEKAVSPAVPPSTIGYNPTFDMWSTAGYGKGGKAYPNSVTGTACAVFWKTNW